MAKRIAMWSGPRSISTALMRSFENRPDTFVSDEPFYGYFLYSSGIKHPGRDEILASMTCDYIKVMDEIIGSIPNNKKIWYQKHMAHHLPMELEFGWVDQLQNCFLIRDPKEVILSYRKTFISVDIKLLGYARQLELFQYLTDEKGLEPPVVDARDILENPRGVLDKLCQALAIPFMDEMLSWPAGPRETDGIWAKYWYRNVEESTGFQAYVKENKKLPPELTKFYTECRVYYDILHQYRIY